MKSKRRSVSYERSILTYIDILGFRNLIRTKTPNDISRSIRVVREAVEPRRFKSPFPDIPAQDFLNFSDLCIIRTPLARKNSFPAQGEVHSQILHMVHVQTNLLFDEGILLRGGITVGDVARSYGQLFGPAVIRGYTLESEVARFPRVVVGEEVLDAEGQVNAQLTVAYSRLKRLERESDASVRDPLLAEAVELLDKIIPLLSRARVIMRMEPGIIDKPTGWY